MWQTQAYDLRVNLNSQNMEFDGVEKKCVSDMTVRRACIPLRFGNVFRFQNCKRFGKTQ